jgi:hypothetical protein
MRHEKADNPEMARYHSSELDLGFRNPGDSHGANWKRSVDIDGIRHQLLIAGLDIGPGDFLT